MATPVPALARAYHILEVMAKEPGTAFTMSELAERAAIHRATCFSTVVALTELGLLDRDERRKTYALGAGLAMLGDAANARHAAYRPARIEMFRLAGELDMTALVCVPVDHDMVVLDHVGPGALATRAPFQVGVRSPISAPFGSIFMAWEPDAAIEEWLRRTAPAAGPRELTAYRETLQTVRLRGYSVGGQGEVQLEAIELLRRVTGAVNDSEREAITDAIAAILRNVQTSTAVEAGDADVEIDFVIGPVFNRDSRVVAAITLCDPPGGLTLRTIEQYVRPLLAATERVTAAIGGRAPGGGSPPRRRAAASTS